MYLPNGEASAWVQAPAHMGVVEVKYNDEYENRLLYKYVDYSSPLEIRKRENIVYVYWAETLLQTNHWILAYDLADRREIVRRKIDPSDLKLSE